MLFEDGVRKGGDRAPHVQKTVFGWVLSGVAGSREVNIASALQCTVDDQLTTLVRQFWEQKEQADDRVPLTNDELRCEELFTRTHSRDATGRYTVTVPNGALGSEVHETFCCATTYQHGT